MTKFHHPSTTASLATRLADLWQAEEHIGYRLDGWLLRHARGASGRYASLDVSIVRRDYHRARLNLRSHLHALGREVVRLPVVESEAVDPRTGGAARGLQRLYHELTCANERLNRLSRMAILQRDYASAGVLSALHERQLDTIELVRELFQAGQVASRARLKNRAA